MGWVYVGRICEDRMMGWVYVGWICWIGVYYSIFWWWLVWRCGKRIRMHTTINPVGDDVKHLECTSHSHLAPHPRYGINKKNAKGVWEGMHSVLVIIVSRRRKRRAVMMRTLCRQKHGNRQNKRNKITKQKTKNNSLSKNLYISDLSILPKPGFDK